MDLQFELDIGKRSARIRNIAKSMLLAENGLSSEQISSGKHFVTKKEIRNTILDKTNQTPKDTGGDARATGDSCGGHGLKLTIEGRGPNGKIWINAENLDKCKIYLKTDKTDGPFEFKFKAS